MTLKAFTEEKIKNINDSKVIYSIWKYNKQSEDYKKFYRDNNSQRADNFDKLKDEILDGDKLKKQYMYALSINNVPFSDITVFEETFAYLTDQKDMYNDIKDSNQEVINLISKEVLENLKKGIDKDASNLEKIKYITEYVVRTIKYDYDNRKYSQDIPFGNDFNFSFYNGIPTSQTYQGLLVTRTGLCEDIANLMVYLGREFNINLNTVHCTYDGTSHAINSYNIDGVDSYIDATSIIVGRASFDDSFLVDGNTLNKNKRYNVFYDASVTIPKDFKTSYNLDEVIKNEEVFKPEIEYVEINKYNK